MCVCGRRCLLSSKILFSFLKAENRRTDYVKELRKRLCVLTEALCLSPGMRTWQGVAVSNKLSSEGEEKSQAEEEE